MPTPERFEDNLSRMLNATLYQLLALTTAREMFQKSYYSLGVTEKIVVDQAVFSGVAANYVAITEERLKTQAAQAQAGFQPPTPKADTQSPKT